MKTYIMLADERDAGVDYSLFEPAEIIVVDEKLVPGFNEMVRRYTVMELNTAVRPFLFKWLANQFPGLSKVLYLDPDMFVYDNLQLLEKLLDEHEIIITPHFTEPVPIDGKKPFEDIALIYGVFNVGFLALNISTVNVKRFLDWWGERTRQFGFTDTSRGLFADQIWFNLVPVYFNNICILRHKGYNMAIWNLHERRIQAYQEDGKVLLDNGESLAIYHFSNWNFNRPKELSRGFNRYNFENRPDLVKLYNDYYDSLQANRHGEFKNLRCRLAVKKIKKDSPVKKALSPGVNLLKKAWHKL